ncbi:tyrosine-type recombinase/integrase [Acinetobacter terrae]|uniref:Site-specific integrase n=1 Tax=Acinetobacter terrae TaxID=2731247 RepID=A0A8E4FEM0_9GAMM|nr:site-specific integrase [Acinetobacter terrae]NNH39581.1 site-specific integrase [Acinetobacter terrae]
MKKNKEVEIDDIKIEPCIRFTRKFQLKRLASPPKGMSIREYAENGKYTFYKVSENKQNKYNYYINDYVAEFPVLIQEDGKIWKLANLYLVSHMLASSDLTGSTLKALAMDLLDYYRFVSENNLDFFYFPQLNRHRVTYQYRNYLLNQVYEKKCKKSTASRKINTVIDFYDRLLINGFISSEDFENEPYERIIKKITLNNSIGLEFQKSIPSSNLAIPITKKNKIYDCINDGGQLRPLTLNQQIIFREYLEKYGNRQLQLMCIFSLLTGARLQTICTLRIYHIKMLINKIKKSPNELFNSVNLKVGGKTEVDTKNNKELILRIPSKLILTLENYINSEAWYERALKNYYGTTDMGYVFITRSGLPYYTSIAEIIDIKNDSNREQLSIRRGEGVRKNLDELLKKILEHKKDFPLFSFHDLRATFGMNYLRFMINTNLNKDQCFLRLKEVMGHSNVETTLSYLDYQDMTNEFSDAQDQLEANLFGSMLDDIN